VDDLDEDALSVEVSRVWFVSVTRRSKRQGKEDGVRFAETRRHIGRRANINGRRGGGGGRRTRRGIRSEGN
jgi:hypothetical protein